MEWGIVVYDGNLFGIALNQLRFQQLRQLEEKGHVPLVDFDCKAKQDEEDFSFGIILFKQILKTPRFCWLSGLC
jgi:hypothetical protein